MVNLVNSWKIDKSMFGPNSEDLSFTQGPNFLKFSQRLFVDPVATGAFAAKRLVPQDVANPWRKNGVREDGSGKDSYQLLEVDPSYGYWVLFTDLESMGKVHKRMDMFIPISKMLMKPDLFSLQSTTKW